jgi:hypothetical protein
VFYPASAVRVRRRGAALRAVAAELSREAGDGEAEPLAGASRRGRARRQSPVSRAPGQYVIFGYCLSAPSPVSRAPGQYGIFGYCLSALGPLQIVTNGALVYAERVTDSPV